MRMRKNFGVVFVMKQGEWGKMAPGNMVSGKMVPGKLVPGKNGPREKWSPGKLVPVKLVSGKIGPKLSLNLRPNLRLNLTLEKVSH